MEIIDFDNNEELIDLDKKVKNKKTFQNSDSDEEEVVTLQGVLKEVVSLLIYLALTFGFVYLIITFVGQRTVVNGSSMENTLFNGDNIIVDKITYRLKSPERFDVIIFPPRQDEDELYIKRIIGLPGEQIYIDADGTIYINQKKLTENYGMGVIKEAGRASQTLTLGLDEYFVMGDNRQNSLDSRFEAVGNVKREDITGKAWLRFYPFDSFGVVDDIK